MNASAVNNVAAIAAALNDMNENRSASSKRGSLNSKAAASSRGLASYRNGSSSGDSHSLSGLVGKIENANEEAMDDEESVVDEDFLPSENISTGSNARARRASEGSYLTKGEGKRSSGELRCEKCGKGYKHSSCLTKHLSVLPGLPLIQLFAFAFLPCVSAQVSWDRYTLSHYLTSMSESSFVDICSL